MMNRYAHIGGIVTSVHDGLVHWTRRVLREAGLETVEVYGQWPPEGTTSSHVVLFPYRLGPAPKLVETSSGISLLGPQQPIPEEGAFIPRDWVRLGRDIVAGLKQVWPWVEAQGTRREHPNPFPEITRIPKPMQKWYKAQDPKDDEPFRLVNPGQPERARLPALWWKPGFHLTMHYMAVGHDGGRGTSSKTSQSSSVALPALSVIASGIHLERTISVRLPPLPVDDRVMSWTAALAESLEDEELKDRLTGLLKRLSSVDESYFFVTPVHDLSNMDFANLMQALQRPLQPALNLSIRLPLGAGPQLSPSALTQVNPGIGGRGASEA